VSRDQESRNHKSDVTVCIIQPRIGELTETFIEAHFRRTSHRVLRLECDPYPTHTATGRPLAHLGHTSVHRLPLGLIGFERMRADRVLARRLPKWYRERALVRYLRRRHIDVVLAEYGPTGVAIRPACNAAEIPLVVHFHGYDAYKTAVLASLHNEYQALFRDAAAIVTVSRDMQSHLIELGAPFEKVLFNPYGIDVNLFNVARPKLNPPDFLAVGRFVEKKSPQRTIRAFSSVAQLHPEARLTMVGDGPLLDESMELVKQLDASRRVRFLGPRSHADVARLMQKARCFVTPASGDKEGTPLAVLEAMASGLAVISTRHGGITDVVAEGETGILVDEGDVVTMAQSMSRLIEDPNLAARFGAAGRDFILREHTIEERMKRLDSILEDAALRRREHPKLDRH
jgi:colanic acid/amylovoran biosynthesis glycosyltransferase